MRAIHMVGQQAFGDGANNAGAAPTLTPVHLDLTARGQEAMETAIAALDMRTTQVVSVDLSGA